MRSNCSILLIIISFVLLSQVGCQERAKIPVESEPPLAEPKPMTGPAEVETEQEAVKPEPIIMFDKVVHDFGEMGPGAKKTAEFKFTNTGEGLLKIADVEECCGVATKLEKRQYLPGESGILKVEYSSGSGVGVMRRELYVISNDKTKPKTALTIKAKIVPKIAYEPQRGLRLFLEDENAESPKITLTSLDGKPFSIEEFKSTGNCISADYDPSVEATKFVLQLKIDKEKLQRSLNGLISISLTHPESGTITIPFNALPRFKITPAQIIVFDVEPGKPITRNIWVHNNYGTDFEIESVSSQNNTVKVLNQDKIRHGYQFGLEIMPPAAEGKTGFTDILRVNVKGGEKLAIKCSAYYLRRK